ncbi:hypothetical protein [Bacillus pumilus]|nr:hypothetical protein [Bacillus pumilus]
MSDKQKKTTPAATEVESNNLLNLFKPTTSKCDIMSALNNTKEFLKWAHQNEWNEQQIHQVVKVLHSLLED